MLSKTSVFNPTLFRKNLTTYWPLWAVYGLIWLLVLPTYQFTLFFGHDRIPDLTPLRQMEWLCNTFAVATDDTIVVVAVVFGLLFAMALFSYLHNARAVSMMHSFPITRRGLYCTQYVTGLAVIVTVHSSVAVLSLLVQGAAGCFNPLLTGQWLVASVCTMVFFFSFGVFCSMFTGQILAVCAYYGILNAVAYMINAMMNVLVSNFMYGLERATDIAPVAQWLTPTMNLIDRVYCSGDWDRVSQTMINWRIQDLHVAVIYGAVGLVLALWGFWVYTKRPSETAGDAVAVDWAKPLFRFGVALCAGMVLGQGIYLALWVQFFGASMVGVVCCMVLMGLVGALAAEMILRKSFKVLRQTAPTAVVASVMLVLLGCAVEWDVLGVEKTVPKQEDVYNLSFSLARNQYIDQWTDDPYVMEQVIALHQQVVDEQESQEALYQNLTDDQEGIYFYIAYYDASQNRMLRRDYDIVVAPGDLNDPTSLASRLQALYSDPTIVEYDLFGDMDEIYRVLGGEFNGYNDLTDSYETHYLTAEEGDAIYRAIQKDLAAGHIYQNVLFSDDYQAHFYENTLRLNVTRIFDEVSSDASTYRIDISDAMTYTLAVLQDLGYSEQLVTYKTRDLLQQ